MVANGTKAKRKDVREDVQGNQSVNNMEHWDTEEIQKRTDSVIENISVLRLSLSRIEMLDGYRKLLRDMLEDARVVVDAHGPKALVKKIDKALKDTEE